MKTRTLPISSNNSISEILDFLHEKIYKITKTIRRIKKYVINTSRRIAIAIHPQDYYPTMKIEHLHNSCKKLDNSSRKVFFLYVKGYSLNEISSLSGTHHEHIIPTVHSIVKEMHRNRPSAQA